MARPKKANRFNLKKFSNPSGETVWRVTGTQKNGTRIRQNFGRRLEAVQRIADLEIEDDGYVEERPALRTSLTPGQLADAEAAIQHIGSQSLARIVSHYQSLTSQAQKKDATIDEAIAFFENHFRRETQTISIFNATNQFLESRINISPATRRNYKSSFKFLLEPDPNKEVHLFTVSDLEAKLNKHRNQTSRKSHQRIFAIFFRWCLRHHYVLENPCERLETIQSSLENIGILPFPEVKRLLYAAIHYQEGAAVAPLAIALFAGLRPSEINDLKPTDITRDKIRISGGKLRRKLKRTVPLSQNLKSWLKEFPFKGIPTGWTYKINKLREAAKTESWCHDVLRHTSITYQAERDKNEALTAFNNGTSKRMMDLHYRDVLDDDDAVEEFWQLSPDSIRAANFDIKLPTTGSIEWPTRATLKKLVWQRPMTHLAKELGISNVAIKKRCTKLDIDLPPRGHWLK